MIPVSKLNTSPIIFLATPAANSFEELESMGLSQEDIAEDDALCELLQTNKYLSARANLSGELEKAKHVLDQEKQHLQREKARTDELLHMMLPSQVACELQKSGSTTPREFTQVSISFTGLTNFQQICMSRSPLAVVTLLNTLFKSFDGLVEKHHIYKVETTGDSYMMVAGLPDTATEHAQAVTNMAFNMREVVEEINETDDKDVLELVIGIHSGPVVAGVIGRTLPRYCLFGDTVNTASRMNSTGRVGKIHISEATHSHLNTKDKSSSLWYDFENRGKIYVKGLGLRTTYFVEPSNKVNVSPVEIHPIPKSIQSSLSPPTVSILEDDSGMKPIEPSWSVPTVSLPNGTAPGVSLPNGTAPGISLPNGTAPGISLPNGTASGVSLPNGIHVDDSITNNSKALAMMKAGHLKCPFAIYHKDSIESDVDAIPVM